MVLLHGMGRSPRSMRRMGKKLMTHGYQVINEGYPSTEKPISELVGVLVDAMLVADDLTRTEPVSM